jgi:hypothetical protein
MGRLMIELKFSINTEKKSTETASFIIDSQTKYIYLVFVLEKIPFVEKDKKEKATHGC